MTENGHVTGRVFTKLFFAFVVVLFLGMAVLDFSLRQVMEQSLRAQAEESLSNEARLLAAQIMRNGPDALEDIVRRDAGAANADIDVFDSQGRLVASSQDHPQAQSQTPPEVAAILNQHHSSGRFRRGGSFFVAVPAGPLVVRLASHSPTNMPSAVQVLRRGIVLASLFSLIVATLLAAV